MRTAHRAVFLLYNGSGKEEFMDINITHAKDNMIEGCLALEGGAFRGVYTSGVIDALMENDINLSTTVGISAGGLNGMCYVSGDIGRAAFLSVNQRHNKDYVSMRNILKSGSVVNFNYVFENYDKEVPINEERLFHSERKFYVIATNLETGRPVAFDNSDKETLFKAIAASASMPLVSTPVKIGDGLYLDGGCSTKLPVRFALRQGFEKIIFVATRDKEYRRKEVAPEYQMEKIVYAKYPAFVRSLKRANALYNSDCDLIDELVEMGEIFRIAPSKPVTIGRMEDDLEVLEDLYRLGYDDTIALMPKIKEYLAI